MYPVDNEALTAWSTLAAAVMTLGAVIVALWQSGRARKDLNRQLAHQSWLEQKKVEEKYLTEMLSALGRPYVLSQDFYFSMLRLLAPFPLNLPKPPGLDEEVRRSLDRFAEMTTEAEGAIGNFYDIVGALRELHRSRGNLDTAQQLDALMGDVQTVMDAASKLREWLATPDTILSIHPGEFFDLPLVTTARESSQAASRNIARRIVRLYEIASG